MRVVWLTAKRAGLSIVSFGFFSLASLSFLFSASGGSASISLPYGNSVVDVYAAFQPTAQTAQRIQKAVGEKIVRTEVSSRYRGASEVVYITQSGKRIPASKIALVP
jgi:hypothetical protein